MPTKRGIKKELPQVLRGSPRVRVLSEQEIKSIVIETMLDGKAPQLSDQDVKRLIKKYCREGYLEKLPAGYLLTSKAYQLYKKEGK